MSAETVTSPGTIPQHVEEKKKAQITNVEMGRMVYNEGKCVIWGIEEEKNNVSCNKLQDYMTKKKKHLKISVGFQ